LDAFTSEPFCGNPCAVLPQADGLSDRQMQMIAMETNLSETAFVLRSEKAGVKVRYFTPRMEVPFAGHPTIATAMMLAQEKMLPSAQSPVVIDFEYTIGVLPVEIHLDPTGKPAKAIMTQQKPLFGSVVDGEDLMACFGLDQSNLIDRMPVQIVSTGVPFLIAPVKTMAILKHVQVNRPLFQSLLTRLEVSAVYMFCLEGFEQDSDAHGRLLTFAEGPEDPFTGSAVGCMGSYIAYHGLRTGPLFKVEQGHLMGRPGTATVEIIGAADKIESVKVGGCAVRTMDGFMYCQ
ncbi:MAG: PhzF family phenazine biosynthesis protein, partial [Deltaproteobacteria bacterium]|nr:PhzF family phenazine biosynthesis protein [Deltaproteobacteria bacterium]